MSDIDSPLYIRKPKNIFQWLKRKLKKPSICDMYGLKSVDLNIVRLKQGRKVTFVTIHELVRYFEQVPRTLFITPENMGDKIQGASVSGVFFNDPTSFTDEQMKAVYKEIGGEPNEEHFRFYKDE